MGRGRERRILTGLCNLWERGCLAGPLVDVRGRDLRTGGDHVLAPKREGNKMLKKHPLPPRLQGGPQIFLCLLGHYTEKGDQTFLKKRQPYFPGPTLSPLQENGEGSTNPPLPSSCHRDQPQSYHSFWSRGHFSIAGGMKGVEPEHASGGAGGGGW